MLETFRVSHRPNSQIDGTMHWATSPSAISINIEMLNKS
jgi:hypothetical protein